VQTTQQDNLLLRQDLVVQKEREVQLVKRNMELEAKLIRALTPRGVASPKGERESPVGGGVLPSEAAVVPPILRKGSSPRAVVAVAREDKACMTDLPPPLTVESPTSSSPSKCESPVKEGAGPGVRKSRSKVKVKRAGTMDEVTEAGEVFGRGAGVDGGTPSPSPSRGEKMDVDEKAIEEAKKVVGKVVEEATKVARKVMEEASKPVVAKPKPKAASLTRQPQAKEVKGDEPKKVTTKESDKKEAPNGTKKEAKKVTIEESDKKMPPQKEELRKPSTKPNKSNSKDSVARTENGKLIVNVSDTRSKVIEGDDFRVTITSNQDMVSCELSDREDEPGSPRKKIVITPKTPDKKVAGEKRKSDEKKEEVVVAKKATGKIPIRQQYIKQVRNLLALPCLLLVQIYFTEF
jgi:hypothetical protein